MSATTATKRACAETLPFPPRRSWRCLSVRSLSRDRPVRRQPTHTSDASIPRLHARAGPPSTPRDRGSPQSPRPSRTRRQGPSQWLVRTAALAMHKLGAAFQLLSSWTSATPSTREGAEPVFQSVPRASCCCSCCVDARQETKPCTATSRCTTLRAASRSASPSAAWRRRTRILAASSTPAARSPTGRGRSRRASRSATSRPATAARCVGR